MREISCFHESQFTDDFPFANPIHLLGTECRWAYFKDMQGNSKRVPEELVYLRPVGRLKRKPLDYRFSSGLATSQNIEDAVLRGALEVIERDAAMTSWRKNLPWQRVSIKGTPIEALRDLARSNGQALELSRVRGLGGVWVYFALLTKGVFPCALLGSAAGRTNIEAAVHAVHEAMMLNATAASLAKSLGTERTTESPADLDSRLLWFAQRGLSSKSSPSEPEGTLVAPETALTLDRLAQALRLDGYELLYADITLPEVATTGLRVGRTIIPGAQAYDVNERFRHLGGRRLGPDPTKLFTEPHPFC